MINEQELNLLHKNQRIQIKAGNIKAEGTLDKEYKKLGCLKIDDGSTSLFKRIKFGTIFP